MIYRSQEELEEAVKLWQGRLRLQDWDIHAEIVDGAVIDGADATCRPFQHLKRARIRLINPDHYHACPNREGAPHNHQSDLIHEMLHIHFDTWAPSKNDEAKFEAFEQTVEVLASCFDRMAPCSPAPRARSLAGAGSVLRVCAEEQEGMDSSVNSYAY